MSKLRLLDLFSGIGGFSLGLERSGGFETVAFCEIEDFPRRVLAKHWPKVPCYHDIRELTADRLAADGITVDAICGGFPCQDISNAGKQAGIEGERSGLWSEYARLIGELRPRVVFVENVSALLGRGLDRVLGDLAALGYDAFWTCIRACDVGAKHGRDRIWIVANANSARLSGRMQAGANAAHVENVFARVRLALVAESAFPSEYWSYQPVLGRGIHGLPAWLDGDLDASAKGRPFEALRLVCRSLVEKAVHIGSSGRQEPLSGTHVLRQRVPEAGSGKTRRHAQADDDVACEEVQEISMPRLRGEQQAAHSSPRSQRPKQRAIQSDDVVCDVSQSTPFRANRVAALGNAVVPQIPELLGRAWMEASA